ncbi:MAG: peptidase prolyl oligopeptidase active site domain protein [Frankiales bacterium]|nr:peptidase prolyl oligopeptidase active site domain protein [Frankiales bacterium]
MTPPAGAWPSPLSAADASAAGTEYGQLAVTDGGRTVWWTELRPSQGGRSIVLRSVDGGPPEPVVPEGFDARTRLHEYGGACWTPYGDGLVVSGQDDQRLYVTDGSSARPLTPDTGGAVRYGEPALLGDSHVLVVRETLPATTELVAVPLNGGDPVVLWNASHFVRSARVSPDGTQLAFLTWEHPQMPWDGTELRVAPLLPGPALGEVRTVLGSTTESVFQPEWEPGGSLRAVTDRSGWWNLVRDGVDVWPTEQECGWPGWVNGYASHATLPGGEVAVVHGRQAKALSVLAADGAVRALDLPFTAWSPWLVADGATVVGRAATASSAWAVVAVDTATGSWREVTSAPQPDPAWAPVPESVQVPSAAGRVTYAHVYPPTNPEQDTSGAAPYVVFVHGGPTSQVPAVYAAEKAYWTSRGFGVADVDYGGSTGHGRAYRDALKGRWGVVDVEDCEAVAGWLQSTGRASSVFIRGGSAGGWTVLCALTRGGSVFAGGASYFGVVDLLPFAQITHDFESRYLDSLIGPLPQARELYVSRSPLSHMDTLDRPLLVLQGLEDKVVPPSQAELLVQALADRGVPHAYLAFAGEGHGFRTAEHQVAALEAELSFYGQVLGIAPPGVPVLALR